MLDDTRRQTMQANEVAMLGPDRTDAVLGLAFFFLMVVLNSFILFDLWHIRDEAWLLVAIFGLLGLVALAHAWVGRRDDPPRTQDPERYERALRLRMWQKRTRNVAFSGAVAFSALLAVAGGGEGLPGLTAAVAVVSGAGLLFCIYTWAAVLRHGRDALDLSGGVVGVLVAPLLFVAGLPVASWIERFPDLPTFDQILLWLF